jgi:Winged helix DNA-binding domain
MSFASPYWRSAMLAERLTAQLLAGEPASDPVAVAERLLAIQGQDPRGARLAIRSRTTGLSATDVDRALTEQRTLVIATLNRGTLHLVRSEDYHWLHALTAPALFTANARRLAEEGVPPADAERAVKTIEHSLAEDGPLTRHRLRERIAAADVRTEGQAIAHLLLLASLRGLIVRGPMRGRQHAFALVRDWLGDSVPVERDRALAELARRYLIGHAPADERDLAKWSGLPLRDVRMGLNAIAPQILERPDGLLELAARKAPAALPPPRLPGAFDPVLLGWRSREAILGPHQGVVTVNGLFRPFALVRGRALATWRMPGGKVELDPFARLSREDRAALASDAEDVVRFLGGGKPDT